MATIYVPLPFSDSAVADGTNPGKSGLTPIVAAGMRLDTGASVLAATVTITAGPSSGASGYYVASYDPEANGEAIFQFDGGSALTKNIDRFGYLIFTRDSGRILAGISAAGVLTNPVTASSVTDKTGYSLAQTFPANFSSLGISSSGKINEVALVDTITTYTGDTPQTGDLFAVVNPMISAGAFTSGALVHTPTGSSSFPGTAPSGWITTQAFANGATLPVVTDVTNPVKTATPASGSVLIGSTKDQIILAGLPDGMTYAVANGLTNQRLLNLMTGESRYIANCVASGGHYVFTFGGGSVEAGPFSVDPAEGDLFSPMP